MFTVKIMNFATIENEERQLSNVYLREWSDIEVWLPSSQNFKDKTEALEQEVYNDYHSDLDSAEMTGEELEELIRLQSTYIAFITYTDEGGNDNFYCVVPNEEVYITNSDGKTVYLIN